MTEEYAVGQYFRPVMVIESMLGDTAHHNPGSPSRIR